MWEVMRSELQCKEPIASPRQDRSPLRAERGGRDPAVALLGVLGRALVGEREQLPVGKRDRGTEVPDCGLTHDTWNAEFLEMGRVQEILSLSFPVSCSYNVVTNPCVSLRTRGTEVEQALSEIMTSLGY